MCLNHGALSGAAKCCRVTDVAPHCGQLPAEATLEGAGKGVVWLGASAGARVADGCCAGHGCTNATRNLAEAGASR